MTLIFSAHERVHCFNCYADLDGNYTRDGDGRYAQYCPYCHEPTYYDLSEEKETDNDDYRSLHGQVLGSSLP